MLDPQLEEVLAGINAARPAAHEVPIEQLRAAHEAETELLSGPGEPVAEVRDVTVPGPGGDVPVRVYRPQAGDAPLGVVVYFHGGGWS
jgi:acetyl esterase